MIQKKALRSTMGVMEYSDMQELADPNISHPFQGGKQILFNVFSKWH